ncbi:hypothetical protein GCK32_021112 [Trichostrongylus colubriformis]|nr:hypothetical protein TELCIR_25324 [Teladorsagia circumcincta]
MLNNNTSIAPLFERILQQFARLRSKNAFIDRFQKEEGFSVDMMDSSAERVHELIDLYAQAEKPDFLG